VIKSFADEGTLAFWQKGKSRTVSANVRNVAKRKLAMIDAAKQLDDLKVPRGNKLHSLLKKRIGQHAIWINDKYRVCFTWKDGDAYDVEITDYQDD